MIPTNGENMKMLKIIAAIAMPLITITHVKLSRFMTRCEKNSFSVNIYFQNIKL